MALDPVSAVLDIGGKIIDRIWPDPAERDKAKLELLRLQQEGALKEISGQLAINAEEAKSSSVFVAGWRPFIGWICGASLGYAYIGYPFLVWLCAIVRPSFVVPRLTVDNMLYELLFGMLGLGALRTVEKIKGVAS